MPHVAQNPSAVRDFAPADLPDVPDLAGLQKVSFERFLQAQTPSDERASQGLEELLRQSIAAEGAFDFLGYELVPGDLTPAECQRFGRSYAAVLQVRIASGEHGEALADAGSIPLMTGRGTFIVNGVEKVVVGCLQAQEDTLENDLSTRRLLLVGEQLRLALAGPAASDAANFQVEESPGFPALARTIREFFAGSAFVRIAETRNPLTLASQLRLVMQTGVEKRPGYRARCPHPTHFGRLGLLETPEGGRIGINLATAILADVDESGRLLAPFSRSPDGEQITQLLPEEDTSYIIGDLADSQVQSRYGGGTLARVGDDLHRVSDSPELTPVHPQQHLGVSAALIPFIAHDDANRALMGANMQKQAMPLRDPEAPLVQTGLEAQVIRDMAPASGSCSDAGVLALGRNLLTAFMCWEGYNFEDGIVVSEDVVRHGLLDTVQVREYTVAIREGKSESLREDELVATGAAVSGGDVLIARTKQRASGQEQDTSVRLPRGMTGTVTSVEHHRARDGAPLAAGVSEFVRVRVEAQRPLRVGDKLCTRHGAKGVVTTVVPTEDMPMLPDGRRVQVLMNPLGVPSRMNIGVLLETHLGMAAHELGITVTTPGFCGASVRDIETLLREAGCPESGMYRLRDGRNGRPFDQETTVGYIYVLRLDQMVEDKRQERSVGPRDQGTSQPVSGRRNGGGQRVGIMETWALQGHGASHILWEMLTVKSDDVAAQEALYDALVNGGPLPRATVCESVKRLVKQLRGLCLDLQLLDSAGDAIDILRGDPHISGVMTARLQFASADRILAWSGDEVTSLEEDELSNGHIRLASPVAHAWRTLAPDLDTCELTCLPTIPRELRGGARLDAAYAAVLEANSECREKNGADGTAEALQGAVDGLLNGLTRLLYGKKGWITTAMSGKSVDYSARSVVCPGPELDYDTCSLPIATAAVLFEPFAVGEIIRSRVADTPEEARNLLALRTRPALDALRRVIQNKYVLLHRAPTLHRLGIQAFRPRLADEDVIRIHPLTPTAFNADFDGDEMDVFLPLGDDAQREARERVASSQCQLSPANGSYLACLSQDMVLGCHYATHGAPPPEEEECRAVGSIEEVEEGHENGSLGTHDPILLNGRRTRVGSALFNHLLPPEFEWVEGAVTKEDLRQLLTTAWHQLGAVPAAQLADALMRFGFHQATLSGLSIGKDTLKQVSSYDKRLTAAWNRAKGIITEAGGATDHHSACSKLASHWMAVVRGMAGAALRELAADRDGLNGLHLMLASGARGSQTQARQHVAMRGLMARPDNRIMRSPITTSFWRGHTPLEYFASTFGARRGLADTALKTNEAGFLFKRIMKVVQDVVIVCDDCGCTGGLLKTSGRDDTREWLPLAQRVLGRAVGRAVTAPGTGKTILAAGETIRQPDLERIARAGVEEISVRSPVTCNAVGGLCAACLGVDLATWQPPRPGQTVGVVAAQSIGEPATQLTMRTFHVAMPPKCVAATQKSVRPDILGGLPRLSQLLEAWEGRNAGDGSERAACVQLLQEHGPAAAAAYLLDELQKVYRAQGVRIDDRHFEIVLGPMLRSGLQGITALAASSEDFLVAGSAYGGTTALARSAAEGRTIPLNTVRACTAFGKLMPS